MRKTILLPLLTIFMLLALSITAFAVKPVSVNSNAEQNKDHTIIYGTVFNLSTDNPELNAKLQVEVYCEHDNQTNLIGKKTINSPIKDGSFEVKTENVKDKEKCLEGDYAWAIVKVGNQTYMSDKVQVVEVDSDYDERGATWTLNEAQVNTYIGVPEFNTMTFGVAILGLTFALMIVRRKE